jgi:IS30 family transposase
MPSGYPFSTKVRREFLGLVCQGIPVIQAERVVGVSLTTGSRWWRGAGAMKLRVNAWGRGGLAHPGNPDGPGGPGHRLSLDERMAIMGGLDARLSYAEIGRRIGRDRSVVWREHQRNCNPDGDYHARMAHAGAAQKACRPRASQTRR